MSRVEGGIDRRRFLRFALVGATVAPFMVTEGCGSSDGPKDLAFDFVSALGKGDIKRALSTIAPDRRLTPNIEGDLETVAGYLQGCQIGEVVVREDKTRAVAQASILFKEPCGKAGEIPGQSISFSGMTVGLETADGRYYVNPFTTQPIQIVPAWSGPEIPQASPGPVGTVVSEPQKSDPNLTSTKEQARGSLTEYKYSGNSKKFGLLEATISIPREWQFRGLNDTEGGFPGFLITERAIPASLFSEFVLGGGAWMAAGFYNYPPSNLHPRDYPRFSAEAWWTGQKDVVEVVEGESVNEDVGKKGGYGIHGTSRVFQIKRPAGKSTWIKSFVDWGSVRGIVTFEYGSALDRRPELERVFKEAVESMNLRIYHN